MMHQVKVQPAPILAADVKCFWMLEEEAEVYNRDEIFPDSYTELIINVGAPALLETDGGQMVELPRAYINPLQTRPLRIHAQGFCQVIAMRLYPWAVRPLLNVEAAPGDTHIIGLDNTWQRLADSLALTVRHSGYEEAINCLQEYVCDIAYRRHHDVTPIRAAGHLLRTSFGQLRMGQLAAQCNLSPSQFERRFKQFTAVSPKTYARLVRFEAVRNTILIDPWRRPMALAHDYGYSDQAHFIRDFKTFAECTPGEFAAYSKLHYDEHDVKRWLAEANVLNVFPLIA